MTLVPTCKTQSSPTVNLVGFVGKYHTCLNIFYSQIFSKLSLSSLIVNFVMLGKYHACLNIFYSQIKLLIIADYCWLWHWETLEVSFTQNLVHMPFHFVLLNNHWLLVISSSQSYCHKPLFSPPNKITITICALLCRTLASKLLSHEIVLETRKNVSYHVIIITIIRYN